MTRVAVIGTTTWGTTLAIILAQKGLGVALWSRTEEEARRLEGARENLRFLPGVPFPENLVVTSSLRHALERAGVVILGVPAQMMRFNVQAIRGFLRKTSIMVSAAKGLEVGTARRMSEVIAEEVDKDFHPSICVLSGPNLANEIIQGLPATTVVAAKAIGIAEDVQGILMTPNFRVYTNSDVVGVELGGALKNIIALGAGICDGLGYGNNAKAALITRGLAEITRLGVAEGANPLTFAGLAGLGDLVTTCSSPLSRNRFVGQEMAKGRPIQQVLDSMINVAEGVTTTKAARQMGHKRGVDMPITEAMYQVLFQGKDPRQAVTELMLREAKAEIAST